MEADNYEILGIPPTASSAEIQNAFQSFKSKNARFNAGLILSDESVKLQFPQVWNAYDILSDPQRKLEYDSQFKSGSDEDVVTQTTEDDAENSVTAEENDNNNDTLFYKYIEQFHGYIGSLYVTLPQPLRKFLHYIFIVFSLLIIVLFFYYMSKTPFQLI